MRALFLVTEGAEPLEIVGTADLLERAGVDLQTIPSPAAALTQRVDRFNAAFYSSIHNHVTLPSNMSREAIVR